VRQPPTPQRDEAEIEGVVPAKAEPFAVSAAAFDALRISLRTRSSRQPGGEQKSSIHDEFLSAMTNVNSQCLGRSVHPELAEMKKELNELR
jgi:hypothetical protein